MVIKSQSLVIGAQGYQLGQTCPQGGSQASGRGLPRSSEEGSGGSRWRWSPGHKRKIRKQSLTASPAGPEGLGLRGGLPTAQLGIEGQESLSLQ